MTAISILAIGTEWQSRHGGLSTFNRELCIALAKANNRVVCLVPSATANEVTQAKQNGVDLIESLQVPGMSDEQLLCLTPRLPRDFTPEFLIGHDRITGPMLCAHKELSFPECKTVLLIHTTPHEIEPFKGEEGASQRAEEREGVQSELGLRSNLVLAVGPKLFRDFATDMLGFESSPPVQQINPGIRLLDVSQIVAPQQHILLMARAEDKYLKGLDIAAKAFGEIQNKFVTAVLVVRGAIPGTSDALRGELGDIAKVSADRIRVLNYTDQERLLSADIRRAAVVIMPSRVEGFGLVALEALSAGVPFLVSSKSGVAEVLLNLAPGLGDHFVVPEDDWANRIESVLGDRALAKQRVLELRTRVADTLNWDETAAQLLMHLHE